ncbi:Cold shock protein, CspA family [Cognatiyoonia koreensis]|uniref:Cold shock protein, CspA family n=1 Tax=Cognatiyoonia koreensis TaxID=364200 RepID=A0A1I0PYZ7_9RHOB|nr:cold shock domain-containing protein [Cognatiyoonia koreensis]SEW19894.1 Cold shock protein, CspA family [Cognatiyoonia koreensis]
MDLDTAAELFAEIASEFSADANGAITEEDVRFRLINRILTEVLGWEFKEIQTEKPNESGFSDYLIQSNGRTRAIVEAKRTAAKLTTSKSRKLSFLKVGGSGLDDAREGIKQASSYCFEEGVDFAVLTNGTTWIAFRASRTDGKKPAEGKAAVFNTLDIIKDNFQFFYELLSREHLVNRVYRAILDEQEGFKILPKEPLFSPYELGAGKVVSRSDHTRDLEDVFDTFFSSIAGDQDNSLLIKCFVESKESQHAEKVLARITSEVLEQIEPMQTTTGGQLESEIERAARANRGEKVLLVGNKGSGKSTFVDRFFELTLADSMRRRCVVLKIDLKRYEGDVGGLSSWLDRQLQSQINDKLYGESPPSYDELQGVFHSTYQSWAVGPHKHLHDSDPTAFKIKFGEHLQKIIDDRPHDYCTNQLVNIVKSRKRLPCIIFDNTDQFSSEVQQAVFQYANAIYEQVGVCFLIVPITDQTVWQLSKTGPLQSYEAKSFFLPVPSTKEVLAKRIEFLASEVEKVDASKGSYALPNGIQVALEDLRAFVRSLEEVFINNEFVSRRIGYLSNFDIRRSLQLSKRIMTSPHIGIDDLIKVYLSRGALQVGPDKLSMAIVNGQHSHFRQDQSEFILNLFAIDPSLISTPFLRLRILVLLLDKQRSEHDPLDSFLVCGDIEQYFDVMGVPGQVTRAHLQALLEARLIEPYNPTVSNVIEGQSVSITTSGELHVELALHDIVYFAQMALSTPIRDQDLAALLKEVDQKTDWSRQRKDQEIREKFVKYCAKEDRVFVKIPPGRENYRNQLTLLDEIEARQVTSGEKGKVKWFNVNAGYGFVTLNSTGEDAFLSLTVLEQFGFNRLETGQAIVFKSIPTSRGPQITEISEIDNVEVAGPELPQAPDLRLAKVVFYNPSKGFGFLRPDDGSRDILLPRRILNAVGLSDINEGETLLVESAMEIKGPVATAIAIS